MPGRGPTRIGLGAGGEGRLGTAPLRSQLGRLPGPDAFWWMTGIENTLIAAR